MRKPVMLMFMVLILSAVATPVQSEEAKSNQLFVSFWAQFKAAVAKDDKVAVAALTKFPVDINANVTKNEFLKKYHEFFNQNVRKCFAKKKPVSDDQSARGAYNLFCGNNIFTFERVGGEYKFTGIGVND